jgi:hypothetical protein
MKSQQALENFVKKINKEFGPPFLPQGFVKAAIVREGQLSLRIGRRDASFNSAGNCVGAGTAFVCSYDIVSQKKLKKG